jgi:septal ring factor EnvC (AmiA/AmiB activator)
MRLALNKKPFIAQSLALSVAALMMTTTHAATKEQQELAQLRAEVAELKALMQQQQQVQQQQAVQIQQVKAQPAPVKAESPLSSFKSKSGAATNYATSACVAFLFSGAKIGRFSDLANNSTIKLFT